MRAFGVVLLMALVLSACGDDGSGGEGTASPTSESTREITGTFTLKGFDAEEDLTLGYFAKPPNGAPCQGDEGYDDISEGAQVVVRDESGTTIATGRLEPGAYSRAEGDCIFEFSVVGVPEADFYSVEVSNRGELTYPRDELEAAGWSVELTLGDEP